MFRHKCTYLQGVLCKKTSKILKQFKQLFWGI